MTDLEFTLLWAGWALCGLGIEIVALRNRVRGDTLSENVWRYVTGVRNPAIPPWLAWAGRITMAGFLAWLIAHFAFGAG